MTEEECQMSSPDPKIPARNAAQAGPGFPFSHRLEEEKPLRVPGDLDLEGNIQPQGKILCDPVRRAQGKLGRG